MHLAERHAALRAARGLFGSFLGDVFGINLVEIELARLGSRFSGMLRHRLTNLSILSTMKGEYSRYTLESSKK